MLLVRDFLFSVISDMIANVNWLAFEVGGNPAVGLVPIVAEFTPSEDLALGDLTFPTAGWFDNLVIVCESETQIDVVNGDNRPGIQLSEPVGGFTWRVTDPDATPITVFGFALVQVDVGGTPNLLMATGSLLEPVTLNFENQTIQSSSLVGFQTATTFDPQTSVIG